MQIWALSFLWLGWVKVQPSFPSLSLPAGLSVPLLLLPGESHPCPGPVLTTSGSHWLPLGWGRAVAIADSNREMAWPSPLWVSAPSSRDRSPSFLRVPSAHLLVPVTMQTPWVPLPGHKAATPLGCEFREVGNKLFCISLAICTVPGFQYKSPYFHSSYNLLFTQQPCWSSRNVASLPLAFTHFQSKGLVSSHPAVVTLCLCLCPLLVLWLSTCLCFVLFFFVCHFTTNMERVPGESVSGSRYGCWCSDCHILHQWKLPQTSSWGVFMVQPHFFGCCWESLCLLALQGLSPFCLFPASDLEWALCLWSPRSFQCVVLLRDHSPALWLFWPLVCHWTLEWATLRNLPVPYLSCTSTLKNNRKSPSWWGKLFSLEKNCRY